MVFRSLSLFEKMGANRERLESGLSLKGFLNTYFFRNHYTLKLKERFTRSFMHYLFAFALFTALTILATSPPQRITIPVTIIIIALAVIIITFFRIRLPFCKAH